MGTKKCLKCGKRLLDEMFYQGDKFCKKCRSESNKTYYERNKDKIKAKAKNQYYETDYKKRKYLKRAESSLSAVTTKYNLLMSTFDENRHKDRYKRKERYEVKIIKFSERIEELESNLSCHSERSEESR
jgi:uncharacterized Zn finger protein (UPF0148 family)